MKVYRITSDNFVDQLMTESAYEELKFQMSSGDYGSHSWYEVQSFHQDIEDEEILHGPTFEPFLISEAVDYGWIRYSPSEILSATISNVVRLDAAVINKFRNKEKIRQKSDRAERNKNVLRGLKLIK